MWKALPHSQCVSVDVLLNEQIDWISSNKFRMWKLNEQIGWIFSNKFHMRKISPHCMSVDALLNGQIGWISSNNFHTRKIIPIGTVKIENL